MDPQQRLLLEVAWEALEDAGHAARPARGQPHRRLRRHREQRLRARLQRSRARRAIDAYVGTGNARSIAAGRISYMLGLRGPSLAVDTACSSSLVAVHLACQSLRDGECDLALAGGVNVIAVARRRSSIFSKAGMLSPDGRCKTFDAAADGYVRGEGVRRRRAEAAVRRAGRRRPRSTAVDPRHRGQPGRRAAAA